MIKLDMNQATTIARKTIEIANQRVAGMGVAPTGFDALEPLVQSQIITGVMNIVAALESLGYRIAPPLEKIDGGVQ